MKNATKLVSLLALATVMSACSKNVDFLKVIDNLDISLDCNIKSISSVATVSYTFEDLFKGRVNQYGGDFKKIETTDIKKYDNKVVDTHSKVVLVDGDTTTETISHIQTWVESDGSLWYGEEDDEGHDSYQLLDGQQFAEYESEGYGWDFQTRLGENQYAQKQVKYWNVEKNKDSFYYTSTSTKNEINGEFGYSDIKRISQEGLNIQFTYDIKIKVEHKYTAKIVDGIIIENLYSEVHYALSDPVDGVQLSEPIAVYSNTLINNNISTESNGRFSGEKIKPEGVGDVQEVTLGSNTVVVVAGDIDYKNYERIGKMCTFTAPQAGEYVITCDENNICIYEYSRRIAILAGGFYAKHVGDEEIWHECKINLKEGQTWKFSIAGSSIYDYGKPDGTGTYTFNIALND